MTWQPLDLTADEYAAPPEPPGLAGLLYRGGRHVVSGPPEAAKTMFAAIVALEAIRQGGRVAWLDFESGPARLRRLLDDLGAGEDELRAVWFVEPDGPPSPDDLRAIAESCTLAVVDAAAGAFDATELDDNARRDAERFARVWITPLWKAGVTSVLLDHVTKNAEGRGKFAIGSERKVGMADVHLGLEPVRPLHRGGNGLVRVRTHKDRGGFLPRPHAAELRLSSDPQTHRIGWAFQEPQGTAPGTETDAWRPTVLMDRVRAYIRERPEPISRSALADAVTGKRPYLLRAIDELIAAGELHHDGRKVVPVPGNVPGTGYDS